MNDNTNNNNDNNNNEIQRDYQFPFQPYNVQTDFMNSLYTVFDSKKIGIFESPTGTVI